jgi:hypothetical protein
MNTQAFDADPHADDVAAVFVAYECGGSVLAPVSEVAKVPWECGVCGEPRTVNE